MSPFIVAQQLPSAPPGTGEWKSHIRCFVAMLLMVSLVFGQHDPVAHLAMKTKANDHRGDLFKYIIINTLTLWYQFYVTFNRQVQFNELI